MSRRNEIVNAVSELIRENGISSDFTISEVARKVDIGKSTIYEYFKNKDDLYKEAVLKTVNINFADSMNTDEFQNLSFEESLKVVLSELLITANQSKSFMEMFISSKDALSDDLKEELHAQFRNTKDQINKLFLGIFAKGLQEGVLHLNSEAESMQHVISSLIAGSVIRYCDDDVEIELKPFINQIYDAIIVLANK